MSTEDQPSPMNVGQAAIVQEMRALALQRQAFDKQSSGLLSLFDAACVLGNGTSAAELRERLHTCLDACLDNLSQQNALTRKFNNLD